MSACLVQLLAGRPGSESTNNAPIFILHPVTGERECRPSEHQQDVTREKQTIVEAEKTAGVVTAGLGTLMGGYGADF